MKRVNKKVLIVILILLILVSIVGVLGYQQTVNKNKLDIICIEKIVKKAWIKSGFWCYLFLFKNGYDFKMQNIDGRYKSKVKN